MFFCPEINCFVLKKEREKKFKKEIWLKKILEKVRDRERGEKKEEKGKCCEG